MGFGDAWLPEEPIHPARAVTLTSIIMSAVNLYERAMTFFLRSLENHCKMYIKGF
jgi:hypothetical protein